MSIAFRVDVEQRVHNAGKYLAGSVLIQTSLLSDELEEIAPATVLQEQIDKELVLVGLRARLVLPTRNTKEYIPRGA